jgi:hypothetical protein
MQPHIFFINSIKISPIIQKSPSKPFLQPTKCSDFSSQACYNKNKQNHSSLIMNTNNGNSTPEPDELMKELDAKWDALECDPKFLAKPIWQQIIEIGNVVPQSEWRKQLPRDFALNAEHYMYGAPRQDEEE